MDPNEKNDLEMKILDIESKMPDIKGVFEDKKEEYARMTVKSWVTDVKYIEMGDYRIAAAKKHIKDITPEGIEYKFESSIVYYQGKDMKIKDDTYTRVTKGYCTNHCYEGIPLASRFEYIKIQPLETDKIKVFWTDAEGKTGPSYDLELKK